MGILNESVIEQIVVKCYSECAEFKICKLSIIFVKMETFITL